jgi:hypothetical protein
MWLKGLGNLKKSNDLTGNQTRDLSPCSIAPQPLHYGVSPLKYVFTPENVDVNVKRRVILGWCQIQLKTRGEFFLPWHLLEFEY